MTQARASMMPNLQILRFVAAALVLISHVQHEALKGKALDISQYHPWDFIYFAGGVDIFFVISGFIMYAIASGDFGRAGASPRFVLRRIVRIVPPYWLFTTAMVAAAVIFSGHVTHSALDLKHVLASYLFLPYENPYGRAYPVLMLGWTLNYEFYFYMVFGAALLLRKPLGLTLLFGVIGGSGLLGMAGLVDAMPLRYWSNPIVLEFLLGILLAMARERGVRLSAAGCWGLIALGAGGMLLMQQLGIASHYWNFRVLWMGLPALLICAGVVLSRDNQQPVNRLRRQLVLLGDASYSIYLSHPFALNAVAVAWPATGITDPWMYVAVATLASLLAGVAVHLLIEKPLTAVLNRRLNARLDAHKPGQARAAI